MKTVTLPSGVKVPALGQGTWFMGEQRARRADEIAALQHGIDLGMTLIDTAEMYGDGATEELVGEALAGRRDEAFLVSKVYPWNASRKGTRQACERSLKRLKTDRIDLYLLHWRGNVPFRDTIAAMEELVAEGKIRYWGVSNLDTDDMDELYELLDGERCQVDQVLYNLTRRGPEYDLLPWCRERRMPIMAYSPIEQGRVPVDGALADVAARHGVSPYQVALAWVLRDDKVIAIPKAARVEHVAENRAALDIALDADDLAALDAEFPPPDCKTPLEML
ncbi:diketogulonate reductase-like aldo/keto reductase [Crenobacter luteus]|uniref:aldo/keto reductase n=1 Tax=Crenobacter luteus TaxID=1452487 RepID=UPI001050F00B|nr:aldo/keto reductase [Crenobacter luteus]TCP10662.1 diketogulonate reductase-like aldo/keto reductase [Crenobacter luteus]